MAKLDVRMTLSGMRHHGRGKNYADHSGAAMGRCRGDVAGAAGDIEKRHPARHSSSIKQWSNCLAGQTTERFMITGRYKFPSGMFEGAKFFWFRNHSRTSLTTLKHFSTWNPVIQILSNDRVKSP